MADNEKTQASQETSPETMKELGEEILKLLSERTQNPSEAFILMQQISIYLWDNYKIDWQDKPEHKVATSRRQRYLEFVVGLVDSMTEPEQPNNKTA